MRVPSPSSRAPRRSAGSSTSRRRLARPGRVISAAPPPGAGRPTPGRTWAGSGPRPHGVQRGPGPGGVRHERLRPSRRRAQGIAQLGRAQRGQVGGEPARSPTRATGRGKRGPVAQRRVEPRPGRSGTMTAPRPASTSAACGSSVTTITRPPGGRPARPPPCPPPWPAPAPGRSGPARPASRDLARASTLTGITSDQVSGAVPAARAYRDPASTPGANRETGQMRSGRRRT